MIFPADEVVYLSYGRLIYIPASNSAPVRAQSQPPPPPPPSRASQSTGSRTSNPSVPSTSTSSTKSRKSTASAPAANGYPETPSTSAETPPVPPRRTKKVFTVAAVDEGPRKPSFLRLPGRSREKTPERRLSFSDYLSQSRERSPNTLAVNGREKSKSRERSPKNSGRSSPVCNRERQRSSSPFLQVPGTRSHQSSPGEEMVWSYLRILLTVLFCFGFISGTNDYQALFYRLTVVGSNYYD